MQTARDIFWMQHAIRLAEEASASEEVPVGAVLVRDDVVLGEGYNRPIYHCDPTAHAEVIALRQGGTASGNYRLLDATLYVTLEPCIMCVGAIVHARVKRLVFGAYDAKAGAVTSVFHILDENKLNHRVDYVGGVMGETCAKLLSEFFQVRRRKNTAG